jgi:hypothetical protein
MTPEAPPIPKTRRFATSGTVVDEERSRDDPRRPRAPLPHIAHAAQLAPDLGSSSAIAIIAFDASFNRPTKRGESFVEELRAPRLPMRFGPARENPRT